ncbi:phytanoyl-CoA dioxygenase family protein, partial [Candidatus Pelagibacter sp.]|nr:phytanoyl-CoA dioxygenase family protein [Candidatus Pelagibacter sp.]
MRYCFLFFKFFLSKEKYNFFRDIIIKLNKEGYCKIDNFYSNTEVELLDHQSNKILNDVENQKISKENIEKVEGEIKVKDLSSKYNFLKRYSTDMFFLILTTVFVGRPKMPSVIFNLKHDGCLKLNSVPGSCKEAISAKPHIDAGFHYLKTMVLLSDVTLDNGPTVIVPGSYKDQKLSSLIKKIRVDKKSTLLNEDTFNYLKNNKKQIHLTGKKGDIYLVDTYNVHWAKEINKGFRK